MIRRWPSTLLRAALLAGACLLAPVANAHADGFDGVDVASDTELAAARGGFLTADGVTFDLGAIITTYQDGQLALQTQLTWTPTGAVATHLVGEQYATTAWRMERRSGPVCHLPAPATPRGPSTNRPSLRFQARSRETH